MPEVGRENLIATGDSRSVRRNSIIKSHEETKGKIMNKRDRNEDVSKSRMHSVPFSIAKQNEAWQSPLNCKSHFAVTSAMMFVCLLALAPFTVGKLGPAYFSRTYRSLFIRLFSLLDVFVF